MLTICSFPISFESISQHKIRNLFLKYSNALKGTYFFVLKRYANYLTAKYAQQTNIPKGVQNENYISEEKKNICEGCLS